MKLTTTRAARGLTGLAIAAAAALVAGGCAPAATTPAGSPTPPTAGSGSGSAAGSGSGAGSGTVRGEDVSDGIRPAAWLLGDWGAADDTMTWVAVDGAIYGVRFVGDRFEATMIDDSGPDHALQLWMFGADGAGGPVAADKTDPAATSLVFAGDAPPAAALYQRAGDTLTSSVTWTKDSAPEGARLQVAAAGARATALEDADRAFRDDTHARGPDGWVAWFAPDGTSWGAGPVVTGHDAIKADIAALLAKASLTWEPSVSRLAPSGTMGFTAGRFAVIEKKRVRTRGSYLTIWKKQADGSWKVAADSGRPEN